MFHSTDWLPTILSLAGVEWKDIKSLDGYNVWDAISNKNVMSPRFEILHQFDPLQKNQCALRVGDYKIILNQDIGYYGDWYPRPAEVGELQNLTKPVTLPNAKVTCDKNYPHPFLELHAPPCDPMKKPCLFNIQWDPCEFHNLAQFMPNTLKVLLERLYLYRKGITKPIYPKYDDAADPENNGGVWGPWTNITIAKPTPPTKAPISLKTVVPTIMKGVENYENNTALTNDAATSLTQSAPATSNQTNPSPLTHEETVQAQSSSNQTSLVPMGHEVTTVTQSAPVLVAVAPNNETIHQVTSASYSSPVIVKDALQSKDNTTGSQSTHVPGQFDMSSQPGIQQDRNNQTSDLQPPIVILNKPDVGTEQNRTSFPQENNSVLILDTSSDLGEQYRNQTPASLPIILNNNQTYWPAPVPPRNDTTAPISNYEQQLQNNNTSWTQPSLAPLSNFGQQGNEQKPGLPPNPVLIAPAPSSQISPEETIMLPILMKTTTTPLPPTTIAPLPTTTIITTTITTTTTIPITTTNAPYPVNQAILTTTPASIDQSQEVEVISSRNTTLNETSSPSTTLNETISPSMAPLTQLPTWELELTNHDNQTKPLVSTNNISSVNDSLSNPEEQLKDQHTFNVEK